jgi:hypothetical protein
MKTIKDFPDIANAIKKDGDVVEFRIANGSYSKGLINRNHLKECIQLGLLIPYEKDGKMFAVLPDRLNVVMGLGSQAAAPAAPQPQTSGYQGFTSKQKKLWYED